MTKSSARALGASIVGANSSPSPPSFCTVNHTLLARVVEVPNPDLSAGSACSTAPGAPGAAPFAGASASATAGMTAAATAQVATTVARTRDNDDIPPPPAGHVPTA